MYYFKFRIKLFAQQSIYKLQKTFVSHCFSACHLNGIDTFESGIPEHALYGSDSRTALPKEAIERPRSAACGDYRIALTFMKRLGEMAGTTILNQHRHKTIEKHLQITGHISPIGRSGDNKHVATLYTVGNHAYMVILVHAFACSAALHATAAGIHRHVHQVEDHAATAGIGTHDLNLAGRTRHAPLTPGRGHDYHGERLILTSLVHMHSAIVDLYSPKGSVRTSF